MEMIFVVLKKIKKPLSRPILKVFVSTSASEPSLTQRFKPQAKLRVYSHRVNPAFVNRHV